MKAMVVSWLELGHYYYDLAVDISGGGLLCSFFSMSILIGIFTFILILVSLFLVLIVLMQKAKTDGGAAAMGGGMAEATFGADTGNVLSKATINASIAFFVLSFLLYLGHIYQRSHSLKAGGELPTIPVTSQPAALPATTTAPTTDATVPATSPSVATPAPATPVPSTQATAPVPVEAPKKP